MKIKRPETLDEIMTSRMRWPVIEPVQRVKDMDHVPRGQRHLPVSARHVWHTYPIRGGVTAASLMAANITRDNALLRRLTAKREAA